MNRILSLIIAIAIICCSFFGVLAKGTQPHWAEEIARELLNEGIISGDSNGLRLDDNIKRSEFVKVINKSFKIEDGGTVNFPDVASDKWYFNEFLKAKNAGYLTGDNNGNANPEANIKRIEAAVILARLLGYASEKTIGDFKDNNDIPEWGRDAVYTLASNKIIKGYTDGSFKAAAPLTRAEAFSLMAKSKNAGAENVIGETGSVTDKTATSVTITGGAGGGGGGSAGGGGGGSAGGNQTSTNELKITWIDEENNTAYWNDISGASSYEVKIKRASENVLTNGEATDITSQTSFDFTELVKSIAPMSERLAEEKIEFTVSCMLNGIKLSASDVINVSFPSVKKPEIEIKSELENGIETLYFIWNKDANADTYTFNVNLDGNGEENLPVNVSNGKCIATIPAVKLNVLSKTFEYTMSASADSTQSIEIVPLREYHDEIDNLLYASGSGLSNDPYVITTPRHFSNIRENNEAVYYLCEDLILDQTAGVDTSNYYSLVDTFKGTLIGYDLSENKEAIRTLTVNTENGIGVFNVLDNAELRNIKTAGNVTTTSAVEYTSPLAGTTVNTNTFVNCENTAAMSVTLASAGKAGGLLGYNEGVTSFTNCYNSADLTVTNNITTSYLGGICGGNSGIAAQKPTFRNCGNSGKITSASSSAAGIMAYPKSVIIDNCYNIGEITATVNAGGLTALSTTGANFEISNSYNGGKISAEIAAGLSGKITGSVYNASYCYNTGEISAATKAKLIASSTAPAKLTNCYDASENTCEFAISDNLTLTDCYYLADNSGAEANGLKPLSDADFKVLSNFKNDESIWYISNTGAYKYPQIKGNPHKFISSELSKPDIDVVSTRATATLMISGSNNAVKYLISVAGNEFEITGGGNKEKDISAYITAPGSYIITVKAIGDGEQYTDSEVTTLNFIKEQFKFAPQITTVTGNEQDAYTITWNINETDGLKEYKVSVYDNTLSSAVITDEIVLSSQTSFVLSESSYSGFIPGNDYKFTIKAIGNNEAENSEEVSKEFKTLFADGDNTSGYIIKNARQFKNIAGNPSLAYYLAADISLDHTSQADPYIPFAFSGKLTGVDADGNEEIRTVNVTVNGDTAVGMFTSLTASTIKNIKITGTINDTGTDYKFTGGIAGTASSGTTTFENCINEAEITSESSYTGGIAGYSGGGTVNFINCKNNGNISSSNMNVGGIAGNIKKTDNTTGCANTGNLIATQNVGGIIGSTNSGATIIKIKKSYNSGSLTATNTTTNNIGGIIGLAYAAEISDCYNAGSFTGAASAPKIGSLIGNITTGKTATLTDCYSGILGVSVANGGASFTDCYQLSASTGAETDGLTPLSSDDMMNEASFDFDFTDVWYAPDSNAAYKYPTLRPYSE